MAAAQKKSPRRRYRDILFEVKDQVAWITINRPEVRNSFRPLTQAQPDGTTLFTEPGASRVHKIDKNGTISVFIENTERANGLALDSKNDLYVSEVTWTFAVSRGRAPADCHTFQKFSLEN